MHGRLVVVHRGVHRTAGSQPTWHHRITAATLAAGSGSVASIAPLLPVTWEGLVSRPDDVVARCRRARAA